MIEAGLVPRTVNFFIVNDDRLNAFVAGGQNIFIHTGLLLETEGPLELSGVLAHEIGHLAAGHLARVGDAIETAQDRALLGIVLGALATIASGRADVGAAIAQAGQGTAIQGFLSYSRAQESAADQAALHFLDRAKQSSRGLEKFLGKLADQELLTGNRRPAYLSTHPITRERLDTVRHHAETSPHRDIPLSEEINAAYARLVAKLYGYVKAPALTFRRYSRDDPSVPARYARAIANLQAGEMGFALEGASALVEDFPDDPYFRELKGQILFEGGQPVAAADELRQALTRAPDEGQIAVLLGRALIAINSEAALTEALSHLEKAIETEKTWPFAWRQLAIAQGRLGQLGLSALSLSEEAVRSRRWSDARQQARRAQSRLEQGSEPYQRAVDIEEQAKAAETATRRR